MMVYVPLGVLAARVTIPLASTLNGPVVNGVTLYWLVLLLGLTYHLSMRFADYRIVCSRCNCCWSSFTASIGFLLQLLAVAVSQFFGVTFNPVDGLASRIIGR
jgi:hypothetical protein